MSKWQVIHLQVHVYTFVVFSRRCTFALIPLADCFLWERLCWRVFVLAHWGHTQSTCRANWNAWESEAAFIQWKPGTWWINKYPVLFISLMGELWGAFCASICLNCPWWQCVDHEPSGFLPFLTLQVYLPSLFVLGLPLTWPMYTQMFTSGSIPGKLN